MHLSLNKIGKIVRKLGEKVNKNIVSEAMKTQLRKEEIDRTNNGH